MSEGKAIMLVGAVAQVYATAWNAGYAAAREQAAAIAFAERWERPKTEMEKVENVVASNIERAIRAMTPDSEKAPAP